MRQSEYRSPGKAEKYQALNIGLLVWAANLNIPRGILVIRKNFHFLVPERCNMRFDNIENCFKLSELGTLLTFKMPAKHASDRLIIQFDPISSKGVIASITKDYCTWSKLRLNSISVKGLDISKPETQSFR